MKPPFDPAMSDGCSIPSWLRRYMPILDSQCEECRTFCVEHDEAYYNGGTEFDREVADRTLRDAVEPVIGWRWAQEWYVALRLYGGGHWGTGRTWDGRWLWREAGTEAP
jgi:hypothetical protein